MRGLAAYGVRSDAAAMGVQRDAGGDLMLATIRAQNADYAFYGGLGLSDDGTWRDVMRGVVATSVVRPGIGTLGGRRVAVFASKYLSATLPATVEQPFGVVVVCSATGSGVRVIFDGLYTGPRALLRYNADNALFAYFGGNATASPIPSVGPHVISVIANGASSTMAVNGAALTLSGSPGTGGLLNLTIGRSRDGDSYFAGSLASLIVISGTNYAARAAAIANAARSWYGTG